MDKWQFYSYVLEKFKRIFTLSKLSNRYPSNTDVYRCIPHRDQEMAKFT